MIDENRVGGGDGVWVVGGCGVCGVGWGGGGWGVGVGGLDELIDF